MSSGFISESEILEARRRRQEEWEKVRTEDQPKEAPEEVYDTRPLFQRLEEQRLKKEAEYEEAHKLKNMIRGLDDDEVGFLDLVEQTKAKAAQMISLEEQKEMREFRERVSNLAESEEMNRLRAQLAPARTVSTTQPAHKNKLQGVVVRKRKASEMEDKQDKDIKQDKVQDIKEPALKQDKPPPARNGLASPPGAPAAEGPASPPRPPAAEGPARRCVGVLPGLGHYDTDSTSESCDDSSDSDNEKCCKRDLLGRLPEADKQKEDNKS